FVFRSAIALPSQALLDRALDPVGRALPGELGDPPPPSRGERGPRRRIAEERRDLARQRPRPGPPGHGGRPAVDGEILGSASRADDRGAASHRLRRGVAPSGSPLAAHEEVRVGIEPPKLFLSRAERPAKRYGEGPRELRLRLTVRRRVEERELDRDAGGAGRGFHRARGRPRSLPWPRQPPINERLHRG